MRHPVPWRRILALGGLTTLLAVGTAIGTFTPAPEDSIAIPRMPKIELSWERWHDSTFAGSAEAMNSIKITRLTQRLYEYHDSGKMGCTVRYKIESTAPEKPLAWHTPAKRDKCGRVLDGGYEFHPLHLLPTVRTPGWDWVGTLRPSSTIGMMQYVSEDNRRNVLFAEVTPDDGYWGEGKPRDKESIREFTVIMMFHPK